MNDEQRFDAYRRQNGTDRMTARQRRRRRHKANHESAPFGERVARRSRTVPVK